MILPGIFASQISGHLYSGPAGAFDALGSVTVGSGGQSSITFSAIPQTYTHLQLRITAAHASANQGFYARVNGDSTAADYAAHYIYGQGSSATAGSNTNSWTGAYLGTTAPSTSSFSGYIVDILDYTSTTKNKVFRTLQGSDANGSGYIMLASSVWLNQSPITSLTLAELLTSGNILQYSNASLYGIR